MTPRKYTETTEFYMDYPTSPWTEPYQTSEMEAVRDTAAAMSQHDFADDDSQSPTHDALSDIYNRVS
jgi:hypothetical protein